MSPAVLIAANDNDPEAAITLSDQRGQFRPSIGEAIRAASDGHFVNRVSVIRIRPKAGRAGPPVLIRKRIDMRMPGATRYNSEGAIHETGGLKLRFGAVTQYRRGDGKWQKASYVKSDVGERETSPTGDLWKYLRAPGVTFREQCLPAWRTDGPPPVGIDRKPETAVAAALLKDLNVSGDIPADRLAYTVTSAKDAIAKNADFDGRRKRAPRDTSGVTNLTISAQAESERVACQSYIRDRLGSETVRTLDLAISSATATEAAADLGRPGDAGRKWFTAQVDVALAAWEAFLQDDFQNAA
jgi:hypothetical protein